jgi:hypothetical protein
MISSGADPLLVAIASCWLPSFPMLSADSVSENNE